MRWATFGILVLAGLSALCGTSYADSPVDFNRDVRPILSSNCFKCHGPDAEKRQAGLRLDTVQGATSLVESGERAITPKQLTSSELWKRITSHDPETVMPPPSTKKSLSPAEIDILKRWIEAGAEYDPHWAFVPPQRPAIPTVKQTDWSQNPIDQFVLARLEAAGLAPSAPASKETWLRRVTLDLMGLPPSTIELDAFLADDQPGAEERVVDRLLASPRYGERWGRRWLDLARYADTNGYEKDRQRSVWPYRDWVVRAFNADMPFDQFTIEQLAGDLLPQATLDQRIATGFHRNTMVNEEGGIDPNEFRFYAMVDRVHVTSTAWLGLTMACAQCHTHKFDPIQHTEFYGTLAFLNNADEIKIDVPQADITARRDELLKRVQELEGQLASKFPLPAPAADAKPTEPLTTEQMAQQRQQLLDANFTKWAEAAKADAVEWAIWRPIRMTTNLPKLTLREDGSILASGDKTKLDLYTLEFDGSLEGVTAIRLEVLPDDSLPAHGPGRADYEGPDGDFFLSEFTLQVDGQPVKFAGATETYSKLGIGGGAAGAATCLDGEGHSGWACNGHQGQGDVAVFTLPEPLKPGQTAKLEMLFDRHYSAALGKFRLAVTKQPGAIKATAIPDELLAVLRRPAEAWTPAERSQLLTYSLSVAPELEPARKEIADLRAQLPAYPTALVFLERPADNPRSTHRYHRGEFLQPKEEVAAQTLSILHPFPEGVSHDRLHFARWLMAPENPLTARVIANRQWQAFFGRGLVRSLEDFGYQGAAPSHPELLDWLALEMIHNSWSMKQLHRLIVTSATYRQTSTVSEALLAVDPENVLLSRGPRQRLEGEQLRDQALQLAGLLSDKMYGPSVFPPQPASVTTEGTYGGLAWTVSAGEDRWRRSVYTFAKRTAPYALFMTFDGTSGEACLPRREVSNSPLQALSLMNDTVFVEAAQALGRQFAALPGERVARVSGLFRHITGRTITPDELGVLVEYLTQQQARFESKQLDPAVLTGGDANPERAAWTALARALLNLDETMTKE